MESYSSSTELIEQFFGSKNKFPASQPYIVYIENKTGLPAKGVVLFGMGKILGSKNRGFEDDGSLITAGGVKIQSLIANVTYQELMTHTVMSPFTVGGTFFVFNFEDESKVFDELKYTASYKQPNGNQALCPSSVKSDRKNVDKNGGFDKTPYRIDALTEIEFEEMPAACTLTIYMFPSSTERVSDLNEEPPTIVRGNVAIVGENEKPGMMA